VETTTQLLTGNSIELAKTLPSNSVHCIVTSPPYKGLRRYLPSDHTNAASEIGIEAVHDCGAWGRMVLRPGLTTDELQSIYRLSTTSGIIPNKIKQYYIKAELCGECYVCRMVALFRELKRVLRDDGVCFLNLGDSYNGSGGAGGDYAPGGIRAGQPKYPGQKMPGLKPKDMMLVPQRVALALQADGWWIRQDIIWVKKSAMPEPAKDRFVRAHEVVWLLAKSARYYWDRFAVSEPSDYGAHHAKYQGTYQRHKIEALQQAGAPNGDNYQEGLRRPAVNPYLRNKRDVWVLDQDAFSGAHFATMPRELARICVLAGTSAAGCCAKCGAPLVRDVISGGQLPLEDDPADIARSRTASAGAPNREAVRGR
jgi:DNA modification methylase